MEAGVSIHGISTSIHLEFLIHEFDEVMRDMHEHLPAADFWLLFVLAGAHGFRLPYEKIEDFGPIHDMHKYPLAADLWLPDYFYEETESPGQPGDLKNTGRNND